ncbi:uncharacterized protein LOC129905723 [Episyrphus balteatus]|uniref:uncharacterized protein LOC129905723 n=1 Tax=Episyrphus balteatus TaxID=286459 RepID=UPI0024850EC7|nr:uncharacterized protein LOC129905723 [Episyrphus balteatus]
MESEENEEDLRDIRGISRAEDKNICDILSLYDEGRFITMPTHIRCATHTLNLISSADFNRALRTDFSEELKTIYSNMETKCSSIWNIQNRSSQKADVIKTKMGKYFKTPGMTRWNSLYDSFQDMNLGLKKKFNEFKVMCETIKVDAFSEEEIAFLANLCDIFRPIAFAIDILQGEENIFIGSLIPVLCKVKDKFAKLQRNHTGICLELTTFFNNSLDKRFSDVMNNFDFLMAAAVHPQFKVDPK